MGLGARWSRWVAGWLLVLAGCGAEHPAFIDDSSGGRSPVGQSGSQPVSGGAEAGADSSGASSSNPKPPINVNPGGVTSLDPAQVYLWGTLQESVSYGALALVSSPKRYLVGFDSSLDGRFAKLVNGTVFYEWSDQVRQFASDGSYSEPLSEIEYPKDPLLNDPLIETPCPSGDGLFAFHMNFEGRMVYGCSLIGGGGFIDWYEDGTLLLERAGIDGLAAGDVAISEQTGPVSIIDLASGEEYDVEAITGYLMAFRGHGDGFHAVENRGGVLDILWQVSADGSAEKLGEYPAPPDGIFHPTSAAFARQGALSPEGALFQISRRDGDGQVDVIIRRTVDGTSEIVYDEADDPYVKIHISSLLTGP